MMVVPMCNNIFIGSCTTFAIIPAGSRTLGERSSLSGECLLSHFSHKENVPKASRKRVLPLDSSHKVSL
jgi:hypothetical protein